MCNSWKDARASTLDDDDKLAVLAAVHDEEAVELEHDARLLFQHTLHKRV